MLQSYTTNSEGGGWRESIEQATPSGTQGQLLTVLRTYTELGIQLNSSAHKFKHHNSGTISLAEEWCHLAERISPKAADTGHTYQGIKEWR